MTHYGLFMHLGKIYVLGEFLDVTLTSWSITVVDLTRKMLDGVAWLMLLMKIYILRTLHLLGSLYGCDIWIGNVNN